jgi:hypothetical protein
MLRNYQTENGRIVEPGRFQGEPRWLPYFYELMLDGSGQVLDWPSGETTTLVDIYEGDVRLYPELVEYVVVAIEENSDGFVFGKALTEDQVDLIERQNEREWSSEEPDQDASPSPTNGA